MTFGMPTLIENSTIEQNIALCRELGLSFIELNMNFPEYQLPFLEDVRRINALKQKHGLFFTIHLDENMNVADFNPLVRAAYLETVRRAIRAAKQIGAPILNMHMHHGIYITLPDRKVQMYDRDFDTYLSCVQDFIRLCEEEIGNSPVRICVENTDGWKTYEHAAIEGMLKSPVFRLTWDIGHSKATGEKDMPFLTQHEDRLHHFHIHDGTEEPPKNHLALGDGAIDLKARLALAEKLNCRCVLETKTIAALRSSVLWLKSNVPQML